MILKSILTSFFFQLNSYPLPFIFSEFTIGISEIMNTKVNVTFENSSLISPLAYQKSWIRRWFSPLRTVCTTNSMVTLTIKWRSFELVRAQVKQSRAAAGEYPAMLCLLTFTKNCKNKLKDKCISDKTVFHFPFFFGL